MGRFFALTLNLHGEVKPKTKRVQIMENTKSNKAVWLMVFIALFAVLYLIEVNNISTKGYEIKKLEKRMTDLQESNKKLELESASLKSIQTIESDVKVLNFVPSGNVNYIPRQGYALSAD